MSRRFFTVQALYDYEGLEESSQLSFRAGDTIQAYNQLESGWWYGIANGRRGWFPSNYVVIVNSAPDSSVQMGQWRKEMTSIGTEYYFNPQTGECSLDVPADLMLRQRRSNGTLSTITTLHTSSPVTTTPNSFINSFGSGFIDGPSLQRENSTYSTSGETLYAPSISSSGNSRLPYGWSIFEEGGRSIYYNIHTKETSYSHPDELIQFQQIQQQQLYQHQMQAYQQQQFAQQHYMANSIHSASSDVSSQVSSHTNPRSPIASNSPVTPVTPGQSFGSIGSMGRARSNSLLQTRMNAEGVNLPQFWGRKQSPDGRFYYYNVITNDTTWNIEDINKETGELIKPSKRDSYNSDQSQESFSRLSIPETDDVSNPRYAWTRSMRDISNAINQLNQSARHNAKEKFIPQSTIIVESVRVMLYASGARKDAPLINGHRNLKQHHKSIMTSLSKLVMAAKNASAVWPPPDATSKMQQAANDVLLAVRQFVGAAQEAGIEIRDLEGATSAIASQQNVNQGHENNEEDKGIIQQTNSELISQLEVHNRSVNEMINKLIVSVRLSDFDQNNLVLQVRAIVKEVGNFLSVVDEIPLDNLNDENTVDFKVNRISLYNSISGLVMATQTATGQYAPSNAVEAVILSNGLVEKALKDLLISTKFLIEDQEMMEQTNLLKFIEQVHRRSSEISVKPTRRAMSLNLTASQISEIPENSIDTDSIDEFVVSSVSLPKNAVAPSGDLSDDGFVTSKPPPQQKLPTLPVNRRASPVNTKISNGFSYSGPKSAGAVVENIKYDFDEKPVEGNKADKNEKIKNFFGEDVDIAQMSPVREKPPFLGYDYNVNDIVFTTEGKVKGGTLEALVERLTAHDASDLNYMSAFLLTFRSFTTSEELFQLLYQRYILSPPDNLTKEELEMWRRDKLDNIRTRIYNVLKNWIEKFWLIDSDDTVIIYKIREMAETVMKAHREQESARIIALCDQRTQSRESGVLRKLVPKSNASYPVPILPRSMKRIKFLELDAVEVARQLTIMISRMYEKIQPVELLRKAWMDPDNPNAVNVRTMIATANAITGWVVHAILNEKNVKQRAQYVRLFIQIAEKCRALNNFDTLMAILSGLEAAPIHRLKRTWEILKSRDMQALESLRSLMTSTKNFSKYREELKTCTPPCIPFIGFYFTDLTFIEDGNPDFLKTSTRLINFAKRSKTAEVIRDVQQYQLSYALTEVKELQTFLANALQEGADEQDPYEKSLELEPRESEEGKITRLLQESGFL